MKMPFALALLAAASLTSASQAGHLGLTAFTAMPLSAGQADLNEANHGYRTETVTELRPVTRTLYRDEVRTTLRTVNETVMRDTPAPATPTMEAAKDVSYRPIYETINEVQTETVMKPVTETVMTECTYTVYRKVCETRCREESYTVCKPVTETCCKPQTFFVSKPVCETQMKECCAAVSKPVCETVWKDVCRTEIRDCCETTTKEIRRHVVEKVCEMQTVCKRVPVTECKTCCEKSGIRFGASSACAAPQCNACKTCDPCCKPSLCERLGDRWQAFGDCLGNIGSNIGARIVNHSHLCCCSMVRVPDRITSTSVTHYETVTEQVPVTRYVRRDVTFQEPRTCTKKVAVKVTERVPVTSTKTVTVNESKWVPTTVHRVAQGAYVDRASLRNPEGASDTMLGPNAAGCITPNAVTHEAGGDGRVFVEGLAVTKNVACTSTRMVSVCETRRVPETVTKIVPETVTRQVPTTVTRIVPTTCTKTVPKLVVRMERIECTKLEPTAACRDCCCGPKKVAVCTTRQIPTTCTVKVPYTVTEMVPTTVTRRVPCAEGCGTPACSTGCGSPCHQPGLLDGFRGRTTKCACSTCGECHSRPIRDFFARLCRSRFCCEPCTPCGCTNAAPKPVETPPPAKLPATK